MTKTTFPVERLLLRKCDFREEGIDVLVDEVGTKLKFIKSLCFHYKNCGRTQIISLRMLLNNLKSLEKLDITDTKLGPQVVKDLTSHLYLPKLQLLKINERHLIKDEVLRPLLSFQSPAFQKLLVHDCSKISVDTQITVLNSLGSSVLIRTMMSISQLPDVKLLAQLKRVILTNKGIDAK